MGKRTVDVAISAEMASFDSIASELIDAAIWLTFWIILAGMFGQ